MQNFLRPFREHHIDPTSITRHDFVETNGDNFAVTVPMLARIVWQLSTYDDERISEQSHWIAYWYLCCIFVAMTNQVRDRFKQELEIIISPGVVLLTFVQNKIKVRQYD